MTRNEKQHFRMTPKWKRFRIKMKQKFQSFDYITKQPLTKTWNLHHLDLRDNHYTDISNMNRFMPLNEITHEYIHYLYRLWSKDRSILKRLEQVLNLMYEYTHDDNGGNNGHQVENSNSQEDRKHLPSSRHKGN